MTIRAKNKYIAFVVVLWVAVYVMSLQYLWHFGVFASHAKLVKMLIAFCYFVFIHLMVVVLSSAACRTVFRLFGSWLIELCAKKTFSILVYNFGPSRAFKRAVSLFKVSRIALVPFFTFLTDSDHVGFPRSRSAIKAPNGAVPFRCTSKALKGFITLLAKPYDSFSFIYTCALSAAKKFMRMFFVDKLLVTNKTFFYHKQY